MLNVAEQSSGVAAQLCDWFVLHPSMRSYGTRARM